jgi:hypothetical protein
MVVDALSCCLEPLHIILTGQTSNSDLCSASLAKTYSPGLANALNQLNGGGGMVEHGKEPLLTAFGFRIHVISTFTYVHVHVPISILVLVSFLKP